MLLVWWILWNCCVDKHGLCVFKSQQPHGPEDIDIASLQFGLSMLSPKMVLWLEVGVIEMSYLNSLFNPGLSEIYNASASASWLLGL